MQSSGGLSDAKSFHGKDAILSGPAGGIVGAARAAQAAGFAKIIAFDMGGTSTDVGHFAGEYERALDVEVAGVRLRTPILRIHTVAAGGGSICSFDGVRLRVGPDSAGSNPGPASYRRGGPLTVTDCNVLLGRIQPDFFPSLFGTQGDQPLDAAAVHSQFATLAQSLPGTQDPAALAAGCIRIAVENMANAIKKISVQRGHDVTDYTLTCFGGAAGQHACLVADALGMRSVFIHPLAGVLSAYGIGLADTTVMRQQTAEVPLDAASLDQLVASYAALEQEARAELAQQGFPAAELERNRAAQVLGHRFHADPEARRRLLARIADRRVPRAVQHALRVPCAGPCDRHRHHRRDRHGAIARCQRRIAQLCGSRGRTEPIVTRPVFFDGAWVETPFFERESLRPRDAIAGPAVICERNTTVVLERGWRATLTEADNLVLEKIGTARRETISTRADPVLLEIFNNLFMAIAEQMGVTLANTASSVNIKERLDFSCALFDAHGQLIANAPHMPVHLGSMGESVQEIVRRRGRDIQPGDAFALNAPYAGGTHLPDVTVVMPVFLGAGGRAFFVAARGHHADIGGITPGSMPSDSKTIDEEGVLIDSVRIVDRGVFREEKLRALLTAGRLSRAQRHAESSPTCARRSPPARKASWN